MAADGQRLDALLQHHCEQARDQSEKLFSAGACVGGGHHQHSWWSTQHASLGTYHWAAEYYNLSTVRLRHSKVRLQLQSALRHLRMTLCTRVSAQPAGPLETSVHITAALGIRLAGVRLRPHVLPARGAFHRMSGTRQPALRRPLRCRAAGTAPGLLPSPLTGAGKAPGPPRGSGLHPSPGGSNRGLT